MPCNASNPMNLAYFLLPNISIDCARDIAAMRGISLYQLVNEQVDRLEEDLELKTRCCANAGQILGAINSGINPRHLFPADFYETLAVSAVLCQLFEDMAEEALLRMPEKDLEFINQISERLGQDYDQLVAQTILNL
jgi:hypothetical protein